MFTGLAAPSHLIIVLAIILLLFGAKRIPELAKGLGSGIKEFREGVSASDHPKPEVSSSGGLGPLASPVAWMTPARIVGYCSTTASS